MLRDILLNDAIPLEVVFGHGPELVLLASSLRFWPHPVNTVKALLQEIVGLGHEVKFVPQPQAVINSPVWPLVVTTQCRDLRLVVHAIHLVEQVRLTVL